MALIYKIARADEWTKARERGRYDGSPDDLRDGFIHFSTAEQTPGTYAKYFTGESGLILAAIEADALGEALKWEASRGGALFPHLYRPLDLEEVNWAKPLDDAAMLEALS